MKKFSMSLLCSSILVLSLSAKDIQKSNFVYIDDNLLKNSLLTILRDKLTTCDKFQETTKQLANYLVFKSSEFLNVEKKEVQTPVAKFNDGIKIKKNPILISIWRAGLSLLPTFQEYFKGSSVGFFGIKRNEKTAEPMIYYKNLPKIEKDDQVFILETMLATGGSLSLALSYLKETGIDEKNIIIVCVIAATEGVARLKSEYPQIKIVAAGLDEELNDKKYIVPGLGDYGDRYFGNDEEQWFEKLQTHHA
ncbi:uracil phosphoribosyltransferase [Candidatus Babeliales bacterium]|nr:uracil phosphoribosyltransferase [Candidatus Babeliales bacterium]